MWLCTYFYAQSGTVIHTRTDSSSKQSPNLSNFAFPTFFENYLSPSLTPSVFRRRLAPTDAATLKFVSGVHTASHYAPSATGWTEIEGEKVSERERKKRTFSLSRWLKRGGKEKTAPRPLFHFISLSEFGNKASLFSRLRNEICVNLSVLTQK